MMFAVPSYPINFVDPSATSQTDDFGNDIPGTGAPRVNARGVIMPGTTQETRDAGRTRDQVVTAYVAYLEGEVPVTPSSQTVWRGLTLDVVGNPRYHPDAATGRTHHTECSLVASQG